jgi:hypothetical protein
MMHQQKIGLFYTRVILVECFMQEQFEKNNQVLIYMGDGWLCVVA